MKAISIKSPSLGSVYAELTNENPKIAKAFYDILPISGLANLWGEEVYFPILCLPTACPVRNIISNRGHCEKRSDATL